MADSVGNINEVQAFAAMREFLGSTAWKQVIKPALIVYRGTSYQNLLKGEVDPESGVTGNELRGLIKALEWFLTWEVRTETTGQRLQAAVGGDNSEDVSAALAEILGRKTL